MRTFFLLLPALALLAACGGAPPQARGGDPLAPGAEIRGKSVTVRVKAEIGVPRPAMLSLQALPPSGGTALVISSFGVFGGADGVRAIRDVGRRLAAGVEPETLATGVVWPNEALVVPTAFGAQPVMVVSSGFLVPGKTGAVTLVALPGGAAPPGKRHVVAQGPAGWFYHRALLRDLDGDGRQDILTARAHKPLVGAARGQLVSFRQPADPMRDSWPERVLAEGPDVHFALADLDADGQEELLATQFFGRRLSLHWPAGGAFAGRTVDSAIGSAFDLAMADLDGDGRAEVLATNHEADAKAAVFAYEVPADPRGGAWRRHTLLEGIETRQSGPNQASPGQALAFRPHRDWSSRKPMVLVAGDGSQRAHLLVAASESPGDWRYREEILLDARATVGTCAVGDVDGDGAVEIFVPAYDRDRIYVLGVSTR
ncbi:MAG: VCBS repeat-containing protein [Candidatus Sericytochromatia bacterium]|nr:VCBS repeat-containing protein [Candidatus Tanganyikabacteria bacterium]